MNRCELPQIIDGLAAILAKRETAKLQKPKGGRVVELTGHAAVIPNETQRNIHAILTQHSRMNGLAVGHSQRCGGGDEGGCPRLKLAGLSSGSGFRVIFGLCQDPPRS